MYRNRRKAGVCITCEGPLLSTNYCERHLIAMRLRVRKYYGCKAWRPGIGGHIPMERR